MASTHARDTRGLPRVVVTGIGSVSCAGVGNTCLLDALRRGRSGICAMPGFAALGMRSRVGGPVDLSGLPELPRKLRRFLAAPALYAWYAVHEALEHSGLLPERLWRDDCGLVLGGGVALSEHQLALDHWRTRGIERISPFTVPRGMSSNLSAALAHLFGIGGTSYTISSACTSGAHAIGHAMELIQLGKQHVVLCGGSEELHDTTALWFDAMGALSTASNDDPSSASRPYASQRDGFVLAAGAGILVLESLDHAQQRGATILAEVTGYGSSTEAETMVGPGQAGIARSLRQALDQAGELPDYVNTHACSTPSGDLAEWRAMAQVFAEREAAVPPMSSIKGLVGHAPCAAGALDAVACLLMMEHGFLGAGYPVETLDPAFAEAPLLRESRRQHVDRVLSTNFGFGGTSVALAFRRYAGASA